MSGSLTPLPTGIDGSDLVNAINDRLRRISQASGGTGAAGRPGAPGAPGAGGSTARPIALVTNLGSAFRPALTGGAFQKVVLAANSTLLQTTGSVPGGASTWTLIIDNPTGAMLTLTPDATYFIGFVIAVDTLTRTQITWTNDEHNRNSVSGSVSGNPIPP